MKIFSLVLIIIFCQQLSLGQQPKNIRSVLWKIQYPGARHTSYLLGTDHSFGQEWTNKFLIVKGLIATSDIFYSETGNSTAEDSILYSANLPPKRFSDFFGKYSDRIDSFFLSYLNAPFKPSVLINEMDNLNRQRMFIIAFCSIVEKKYKEELLGIPVSKDFEKDAYEIMFSMDRVLELFADSSKVKIRGLDDQRYNKQHIVDNGSADTALIQFVNRIITFKSGNISSEILKSQERYKRYYDGLLNMDYFKAGRSEIDWPTNVARNRRWAKLLLENLKNQNCFIAVGLGHLFLNNRYGLLDLLQRSGFKIAPVSLDSKINEAEAI
ncbi:TraB/GumN family protein [Niabella pedocola]|uniref:TraB/GumN family protein n=1 Tax=Niabella pedocola TaxID=1752077 RepID=A0ABS8PVW4_9BACT|nr:TraB/GumN family protein [Niabella pedocola]MCD2424433.1 TraB/GumN family protein [Niabella pedocola]